MISRVINFFRGLKIVADKKFLVEKIVLPISMPEVINIIDILQQNGFQAYIVGGGVRDLIIGAKPKDFDIVTDALPNQVKSLFKNSIIIGKRFRLVHVRYGKGRDDFIEVATFRAENKLSFFSKQGVYNYYGNRATDALRRDFSINALLYNPTDNLVYDYCNGIEDLGSKSIAIIGNPRVRFREDPVRILRAIRFAAKLGFSLESKTAKALVAQKKLLITANADRLYLETLKLFYSGHGKCSWQLLKEYGLTEVLFIDLYACLKDNAKMLVMLDNFINNVLEHADQRFIDNKNLSAAFLFAAIYWFSWQIRKRSINSRRRQVLRQNMYHVLQGFKKNIALSNRLCDSIVAIWELQPAFNKLKPATVEKTVNNPRFRAAYDFFLLRAKAGNAPQDLADWWLEFQQDSLN